MSTGLLIFIIVCCFISVTACGAAEMMRADEKKERVCLIVSYVTICVLLLGMIQNI